MDLSIFTEDEWMDLIRRRYNIRSLGGKERAKAIFKDIKDGIITEYTIPSALWVEYKSEQLHKLGNDKIDDLFARFEIMYDDYMYATVNEIDVGFTGEISEEAQAKYYNFIANNVNDIKEYFDRPLYEVEEDIYNSYWDPSFGNKNFYRMWYREIFGVDISDKRCYDGHSPLWGGYMGCKP